MSKVEFDIRYIPYIITLIVIVAIVALLNNPSFFCDGEREWSEYTGKLEHIFMDTDLCCHVYAYFKLNNTGKIYFYNFDKSILNSVHINNTYTFYLEPYPESSATTTGNCFWVQVIYRIIDENGSTVWESRWW